MTLQSFKALHHCFVLKFCYVVLNIGGSEWVQEDTIELNNIKIPDPKHEIDLCMLQGYERTQTQSSEAPEEFSSSQTASAFMTRTKSVPSLSTIQSVKKSISEAGNCKGLLCQKCLVQLDWVATEDGSHLLTVGVGSKVLIYGQVRLLDDIFRKEQVWGRKI